MKVGNVLPTATRCQDFTLTIANGAFTWTRKEDAIPPGRRTGRRLCGAHQPAARARIRPQTRFVATRAWPRKSAPFEVSRESSEDSPRSTIAPKITCGHAFYSACWLSTWNDARQLAPLLLKTRNSVRLVSIATQSPPPKAPHPPRSRKPTASPSTDFRSTS